MKNRIFISLAATALMASFAACSNDTEEGVGASSAVQFSATLVDNTTRAEANVQTNTLSQGLEIGLFSSGLEADADNALLTVGAENALTTKVDLTWKRTGDASFYAYAPYDSELTTSATDLTFAVADDQTTESGYIASDLLYAASKSVTNGNKVNLAFTHKLAKVVVKITVSGEKVTLKNPKVSLLNVDKAVKLTFASGTVATADNAQNGEISVHSYSQDVVKSTGELKCAAIVAPQTIGTESAFIRITTDETSYDCSLSTQKTLESGKSYTFNVTFEDELVDVTYDENSSLEGWDATDSGTDTGVTENLTYTVGDYLLADGSFVKKAKVKNADEVIGVIFSTDLSTTDSDAGYSAYILGFYNFSKVAVTANDANLSGLTAITNHTAAVKDLDGLTYTTSTLNSAINYPFLDLSQDSNSQSLPSLGENFSSWFVPSIGQMYQVFANLGGAKIPETSDQLYYASVSNLSSTSNITTVDQTEGIYTVSLSGNAYVIAKSISNTELLANLKASCNGTSVIQNLTYAVTSATANDKVIVVKFSSLTSSGYLTDDEKAVAWGSASTSSTNQNYRVACIAVKSDKIVAPATSEE